MFNFLPTRKTIGQAMLALAVVSLVLVPFLHPVYADNPPGNLIHNGLFERFVTYDNITIGESWAPFVISGQVLFNRHGFELGQQLQSFGQPFVAGIYQQVSGAVPGATYYCYIGTAAKYAADNSGRIDGHIGRTIGLDPYGGKDPTSPNIVWGSETWSDAHWEWKDDPRANAPKVRAVAQSTNLTLFVKVTYISNDAEAKAWLMDAAVLQDASVPLAPVTQPAPTPTAAPQPVQEQASLPAAPDAAAVPHDGRYFTLTGFRVDDDTIWDYYNHRGGPSTFGYPVSRTFRLQGYLVQFFQRGIIHLDEQGNARLLNVLDPGLMPQTSFNGATVPAADSALVASAPDPADAAAVLDFVRANAPDSFQGMPVNFYQTFLNTVSYAAAFPNSGDAGLLPGFDLEMWGIPTSAPTVDPNNHNFVYLRFQRGIMHYDASSNTTQGILLTDYLKSILTGQNLPADLDQDARNSPFYKQYDAKAPDWVHNASLLPNTDLTNAFTQG